MYFVHWQINETLLNPTTHYNFSNMVTAMFFTLSSCSTIVYRDPRRKMKDVVPGAAFNWKKYYNECHGYLCRSWATWETVEFEILIYCVKAVRSFVKFNISKLKWSIHTNRNLFLITPKFLQTCPTCTMIMFRLPILLTILSSLVILIDNRSGVVWHHYDLHGWESS